MNTDACDDLGAHVRFNVEASQCHCPDVEITAAWKVDGESATRAAVLVEACAVEDAHDPVGVARMRPLSREGARGTDREKRQQAHHVCIYVVSALAVRGS